MLVLGLCISCVSMPPIVQQAQVKTSYTLILYPTLDLGIRQNPDRTWLQDLVKTCNEHLVPLNVHLKLGQEIAWDLSDQSKNQSLDHLWSSLAKELQSDKARREPQQAIPFWIAVNGFLPPSYPKLSQLVVTRRGAQLIMIRQLSQLSGLTQKEATYAMSRLLARAIGEALGGIKDCEQDTMSLSRDELLGWSLLQHSLQPKSMTASPQLRSTNSSSSAIQRLDESYSGRERSSDDPPKRRSIPLTWSKLNQQLTSLTLKEHLQNKIPQIHTSAQNPSRYCSRLSALDLSCSETLNDARLYTHGCLSSANAWVQAFQQNQLPLSWQEERQLAQGAQALQDQQWAKALSLCGSIANHQPSSFASRCAGEAAAALAKDDDAQRYLRAYLSAHPMTPTVVLLLSKVIGRNGEHRAAESLLSDLLASKEIEMTPPQRARALYNLGIAQAQLGRFDEARTIWASIEKEAGEYYKKAQKMIEESTHSSP